MKKDASTLLTEEKFWEIIGRSSGGYHLEQLLSDLSIEEIIGFIYWWRHFAAQTYRQDLWAVAYVVRGGCSDDAFDYFRSWLIAQGKKTVYDAMKNPDSLNKVFEQIVESGTRLDPTDEEVDSVPLRVLDQKSGERCYWFNHIDEYQMPDYPSDIEFLWEEEDPESIRKICPATFDRWWDADDNVMAQELEQLRSMEEEETYNGFWNRLKKMFGK